MHLDWGQHPRLLTQLLKCYAKQSNVPPPLPWGAYSSMIWVGGVLQSWKVDPFLYQIFPKDETHFYTKATNFKQNLLKISHYFPKLLSFQANFRNFGIRLMKLGLFSRQFRKFWKYDHVYTSFLQWIRGQHYTRRLILRPISAACPRIDLCTKTPQMSPFWLPIRMHYGIHEKGLFAKCWL